MAAVRLLDLLILTVLLFILVAVLPAAWNMVRIFIGIRNRRLVDASSFAPPPGPAVAAVIGRLSAIGFRRIGERSTVLPGNRRRFEWDLVDGLTTTYIALVDARGVRGGVLMACYSAFRDGAFVSTFFPTGTEIHDPGLDTQAVGATPEETVAAHYDRLKTFSMVRGRPLENHSMADLLERDAMYRRLHGGATLRGRVIRFVALTAFLVLAAGAELLRIVIVDR